MTEPGATTMTSISKIGHARFETPDSARLEAYYTDILGLEVIGRDFGQVYLACPMDDHSIILGKGDRPSCVELGFHIPASAELAAFGRQLTTHGIEPEHRSDALPGVGELLAFKDPKGTRIAVFNEPKQRVPRARQDGVTPITLGHVAFNVPDVKQSVDFYCNVLGFKFSDSIEDFFVWLRCNPNHHSVNFVRGAGVKMHHLAFEVRDWNHLQVACDFLSKSGYTTIWGPGRHGCGHNLFTYHRDPDGHIIELFAELDQMREDLGYFDPRPWHRDRPQVPKVWPADPRASNLWGPMPPSNFLD